MKTNTKLIWIANKYKNKVMSTLLMSTMVINSASPFVFADVENVENIETIVNTENTETVVNIENTETNENTVLEIPENTENTENIVENETETETTIETENIVENNVENETENNIETETENIVVENPENIEMAGPRMPNENEENIENIWRAGPAEERSANTETENRSAGDSQDVIDRSVELSIVPKDKNTDWSVKTEFLTGEQVYLYATIKTTGTELSMKNAKLKITIPKEKISSKPVFNDITNSTKTETADTNNWYITYTYNELRGGVLTAIPVSYNMKSSTPNDLVTNIKMELIKEDNTLVKSVNLDIINKSDDNVSPIVYSNIYAVKDNTYQGIWNFSTNHDNGKLNLVRHSWYDDRTHTLSWTNSPYFDYTIAIYPNKTSNTSYWNYIPEKVKIEVKIPEGVEMLPKNYCNSRIYDCYSNYIYWWSYDSETRIATYSGSFSDTFATVDSVLKKRYYKSLRLLYPNIEYGVEVDWPKAIITLDPDNPNARILNEQTGAKVKFEYIKKEYDYNDVFAPHNNSSKYFLKTLENNIFEEKFGIYNYDIAENKEVTDITIYTSNYTNNRLETKNSEKIYYENLRVINSDAYEFFKNNPHKIIGIKEDNSEVIISDTGFVLKNPNNINQWFETININDTANEYKKIKIKFDNPAIINKNLWRYGGNDFLSLGFRFKDWEAEKINNYDSIRFFIKWDFSNDKSWIRYSSFSFYKYPSPYVNYNINYYKDFPSEIKFSNEEQLFNFGSIYYYSYKHHLDNSNLLWFKNVILLPNGIEYIPAEWENNHTIINNYKNTGKTAIVSDLWDGRIYSSLYAQTHEYIILRPLKWKIKITNNTKEWQNILEGYLIWENNWADEVPVKYWNNKDLLDIDNDGDTSELVLRYVNSFTYTPVMEVNISQYSSSTKNAENFDNTADIGGDIYYKISAVNNFPSDVNNLTIYDVLPAIGDKTIVPDISGAYYDRGTQFVPTMVESIESIPENSEAIKKFDIYYSTDSQGDGIDNVKNATWKTADQITDFSTVKMLKFQLKPQYRFDTWTKINVLVHTRVPKDVNISDWSKAVNSVAISWDNESNFIESNKTVNTVTRYNVSGVVFEDKGSDGILADRDTRLADYTVALMKSDGTPALNLDNQPITTTTNSNGEYNFTVYARGDYYVAVTKKDNSQTPTIKVAGNNGNSAIADANDNSIIKSILNINPSQNNYIANVGFNVQVTDGVITINLHEEWNRSNKLIGWIFEIYDSTKTRLIETLTTKINWIVTSADLSYGDYIVVNKTPAENYKLSEIVEKNVSLTGASSSVVFTNIRKTQSEIFVLNNPELTSVLNLTNLTTTEKNNVSNAIKTANPTAPIKTVVIANDGIATITFNDNSTTTISSDKTIKQLTFAQRNTINPPEKIKVNNISSLSEEEKNLVIDKIKTANPNWDNLPINSIIVNSNGSVNIVFNDNSSTRFAPNQTVIQKTQAELFDPENITQVEVLDYDNGIYYFENIKFMDGVDSLKDIHYNNANEFRLIFKDNSTLNIEKNKLFKQKEFEKIPVFDIKKLSEEEKQTGLEFLRTFLSPKINEIDFDYSNWHIYLWNWDYEYYSDRVGDLEYLDYSIIFEQYDRAKGESVTTEDLPTINMSDIITLTLPDITSVDDIVRVSNQEKEIVKSKIITKNPLLENMNFEIDNSGNTKIIFPDNSIITLVWSQTVKENPKIGPGGQAPNSIIQTVVPTSTPEIIKNISILPTPEIIKNIPTLSENPDILNSAPEIIFDLSEKNFENISEKNISEKNSENIIKTENNQEKNENPNSEIIKNPIENNSIIQNNPEKNPTKLKLPDFLPATGFENVFMIFVFSSIISYAIISSRRRFDD